MAPGAPEVVYRMGSNVRMTPEYGTSPGISQPFSLRVAGQAMFPAGNATKVNGNVSDDL
jgi:hypothetical protein